MNKVITNRTVTQYFNANAVDQGCTNIILNMKVLFLELFSFLTRLVIVHNTNNIVLNIHSVTFF